MDVLVQQWSDQFPHVGFGIIEEMAFTLINNKNNRSASSPSEIEIESFLTQMNSINAKQKQLQAASLASVSSSVSSSVMNRRASYDVDGVVEDDDDEESSAAREHLLVFTSSITASRQVRDHDRQIRNLLYLLKIPFEVLDVADNRFIQNQVVKMVQTALKEGQHEEGGGGSSSKRLPASAPVLLPLIHGPPSAMLEHCLPMIFYNQQMIGTYLDLQYYVDDEPNHASLQRILKEVGSTLRVG